MSDDPYDIEGEPQAVDASGGEAKGRRKRKARPTLFVDPPLEDCPVIPLGYIGRDVVFALPGGELRIEPASRIQGMLRTDMFVCLAGQAFLGHWQDPDGDFAAQRCAIWFNRACREAGKWDLSRPQRSYGVWPSETGPVVHCGDAIGRWPFRAADWTPVAEALRSNRRGPVWRLNPPTPRPDRPATRADGERLKRALGRWNWHALSDGGLTGADVALGWQGQAWLGACAPFRPHILVVGGHGTGKTTLSILMQAIGSANAGELQDRFTEAGLRGEVAAEARALYLDEAESSGDGQLGPVERAMEMLRRMSTGEGSKGVQIGQRGEVVSQTAIGSAWLGAINAVDTGAAMASRLVEVRLKPLGPAKGRADQEIEAEIAWAREASPAFLARAMRDYARYRSDVSLLKTAFGEAGLNARGADLPAALAAGRRLILHDEPLTEETVADEVDLWRPLLEAREETSTAVNEGQACLASLFSLNSGQHRHDRHLTLGEMIQEEAEARGTHDKVLKQWGLRVENGYPNTDMPGPWLWVANNHPALARAMKPTRFANWRSALQHLEDLGEVYAPRPHPGLGPKKSAPKFGLHQSRALCVPLTPWLEGPIPVGAGLAEDAFAPSNWDPRPAPPASSRRASTSPALSPSPSPDQSHD